MISSAGPLSSAGPPSPDPFRPHVFCPVCPFLFCPDVVFLVPSVIFYFPTCRFLSRLCFFCPGPHCAVHHAADFELTRCLWFHPSFKRPFFQASRSSLPISPSTTSLSVSASPPRRRVSRFVAFACSAALSTLSPLSLWWCCFHRIYFVALNCCGLSVVCDGLGPFSGTQGHMTKKLTTRGPRVGRTMWWDTAWRNRPHSGNRIHATADLGASPGWTRCAARMPARIVFIKTVPKHLPMWAHPLKPICGDVHLPGPRFVESFCSAASRKHTSGPNMEPSTPRTFMY